MCLFLLERTGAAKRWWFRHQVGRRPHAPVVFFSQSDVFFAVLDTGEPGTEGNDDITSWNTVAVGRLVLFVLFVPLLIL